MLIEFLERNMQRIKRHGKALLCSSDIIESIFGRYKNVFKYNGAMSITDMCLIIPALMCPINETNVKAAIDGCMLADLKAWKQIHLSPTLSARRKQILGEKNQDGCFLE